MKSDNINTSDKSAQSELLTAIENAQILLGYITARGLIKDSHRKMVEIVVDKVKNPTSMTKEDEANFWLAYSQLAHMTYPATIESISLAKNINSEDQDSVYKKVVRAYRRNGLVAMSIMLLVQIYWVVGAGLMADVKSLPDQIEKLSSQSEERRNILGNNAADDLQIQFLEAKLDNLYADLEVSSRALNDWNFLYSLLLKTKKFFSEEPKDSTASMTVASLGDISSQGSPSEGEELDDEFQLKFALKYSSYVLGAIQSYILPLLYGLLGAIAYILRSLVKEIKEKSFTQEMRINYLLRVFLGALAGLAIGWFFGDIEGRVSAGISSLSPLALAFLAGYSVEVLFSVMDRFIDMIVKDKPAAAEPATTKQ